MKTLENRWYRLRHNATSKKGADRDVLPHPTGVY
jgi:hypothetical protein